MCCVDATLTLLCPQAEWGLHWTFISGEARRRRSRIVSPRGLTSHCYTGSLTWGSSTRLPTRFLSRQDSTQRAWCMAVAISLTINSYGASLLNLRLKLHRWCFVSLAGSGTGYFLWTHNFCCYYYAYTLL